MIKPFVALLASAGFALSLSLAAPAFAQSQAGNSQSQPPTKPASQEDVNTYAWMASINTCILNQAQVDIDKSLPAAAEMMTAVIVTKHGGIIQGANNNQRLTDEMIFNGSIINVVTRVKAACYNKLSPAEQKKVDAVISQVEKLTKGQSTGLRPSTGNPPTTMPSSKP